MVNRGNGCNRRGGRAIEAAGINGVHVAPISLDVDAWFPGHKAKVEFAMFFQEGFTYRNFLMDVFTIFIFIMWFWLLISIAGDLFRRHDISGWGKAIWIIVLILIPYIGVLAYVISQGRGLAERNMQQAQQAREGLRRAAGFSAADEIEKLDRLRKAGSISDAEFTRLRTQLLQ